MFTYDELEEYLAGRPEMVKVEKRLAGNEGAKRSGESNQMQETDQKCEPSQMQETDRRRQFGQRTELSPRRERSLKRQCVILGAAAILLAAAAAFSVYYDNRTNTVSHNDTKGGKTYVDDDAAYLDNPIRSWRDEAELNYNTDRLVLVNKDNPLPEDYAVELHTLQNGSCVVAEMMYSALSDMLSDGTDAGLSFVVASGYRDTDLQQQLLEEDILAAMEREGLSYLEAYEKETRETMPPGYSEHETGLAVDIVSVHYQMLDERQEMTEENRWLREHCSEYGFILRYPEGKEDITGIDYESWHFRYVGEEAAQEIMSRGLTLEEYLEEYQEEL